MSWSEVSDQKGRIEEQWWVTTSTLDLAQLPEGPDSPSTLIPSGHVLCPYDPRGTPCGPRHSINCPSVGERRTVLLPRERSHRLRRPVLGNPCGALRGSREEGREFMELMEGAQAPCITSTISLTSAGGREDVKTHCPSSSLGVAGLAGVVREGWGSD